MKTTKRKEAPKPTKSTTNQQNLCHASLLSPIDTSNRKRTMSARAKEAPSSIKLQNIEELTENDVLMGRGGQC